MKKFKHHKPARDKLRGIRAYLRKEQEADAMAIADALGISYVHTSRLLAELIQQNQVRISHTVQTASRGNRRRIYALTQEYLATVKSDVETDAYVKPAAATSPETHEYRITYVQRPRKPWFKRALDWLTGDSDIRPSA